MRTPIALYVLAVLARAVLILLHPDAAYPDSYYYANVARSLAEGHGFQVDFIWIFAEVGGVVPADPVLPIPSNAHWMPLASIVQVPFLAIFGANPIAAATPFALIGALAAPMTWALAREAGAAPRVALGAGILTALPGLLAVFLTQPDNFSLYQPLVLGALWMTARGLHGSARSFVAAGLLVGLATLSRNDGLFVGGVVGLAFLWDRWRAWRSPGTGPAIPLLAAVGCLALFLAVMGPWWLRQLDVFGQLSPSTASGKVFFIRTIEEWNSVATPATLDHLLGQGLGSLVASRVGGLIAAIGIYVTLVAAGVLAPFMLIGAWGRRRSVWFGPFFTYAIVLFLFSGLVSAVHVPGGTFIHSAVALAPHSFVLALEGVAMAVGWVAVRRSRWDVETASRIFTSAAVGFTVAASVAGTVVVHANWDVKRHDRLAIAAALDLAQAAPDARLMSIDAAGYRYFTGRGGVVSPDDPIDTVREVAEAYDIEWLVLERDDIVASLAPVLRGDERPAWIGPSVYHIPSADGGTPRAAVYPVCFSPLDPRCATTARRSP